MSARVVTLSSLLEVFLHERPTLRPGSSLLFREAVALAEIYAGGAIEIADLSGDWLLAFAAWRVEPRPVPPCPRKGCGAFGHAMRRLRGTRFVCQHWRGEKRRDGCPSQAVHVLPVTPQTANRDLRHLRALWHVAIDKGLNAHRFVRLRPLDEDVPDHRTWTLEEFSRILAAAKQERDLLLGCAADAFFVALLLTIYDVGPRITALMECRPDALRTSADWQAGTLTLPPASQKQRRSQVTGLSPQTLSALRKIYDPCRDWLFPWPYDRKGPGRIKRWPALTKRLRRMLGRAELPSGRKDLWHKLRRLTATQLTMRLGIEAARAQLGHSTLKVTERYVDWAQVDQVRRNALALPRPTID